MNLKLFYSPPKWRAFEAPMHPMDETVWYVESDYDDALEVYHKAYAEAKANALEVGNAEVIKPVFWEMQSGAEYTWYGSAVIKYGKYILLLDKQTQSESDKTE